MQRRSPYIPQHADSPSSQEDWSRPSATPLLGGGGGGGGSSGYTAIPPSPNVDFGRRRSLVKVDLGQQSGRRPSVFAVLQSKHRAKLKARGWTSCLLLLVYVVAGVGALYLIISALLVPPPIPHSTTYHCPTPLHPRASFPSTLSHFSSPLPVPPHPSSAGIFSLSLQHSLARCNQFRLTVARRDRGVCRRAPALHRVVIQPEREEGEEQQEWEERIGWKEEEDRVVKERLGPDGFWVQIEGAERVGREMVDYYDPLKCEYHYDFTLINAGPIWMNVTHLYEDYSSFLELSSPPQSRPKPPMLMRPLLPHATPIRLSLCAPQCAPYVPLTLLSSAPPVGIGIPPPKLPSCEGYDSYNATHGTSSEVEGGYVLSPPLDLIYPPLPLPLSQTHSRPTTGLYTFLRPHCSSLSPHLSHDGLRLRSHSSCLRPAAEERGPPGGGGVRHRALIIGDSHGRAVFDVTVWRVVRGERGVLESSPKALSKKEEKGGLGLEFAWDPYLTSGFSCDYLKQFDSITISAGTHTAAWNCPTTSSHLSHLGSILQTWPELLTACRTSRSSSTGDFPSSLSFQRGKLPTLILLTIPSFHPQLHNRDCRTGTRISWWNEVGMKLARESGWQVVDYEGYTRAVGGDTERLGDGVHYLKTDAMDPIVDDWIGRLGVCGDEDRPK